jgi:hypothetical protein
MHHDDANAEAGSRLLVLAAGLVLVLDKIALGAAPAISRD